MISSFKSQQTWVRLILGSQIPLNSARVRITPTELRKVKSKEVVDLDKKLEVNKPMTEEESKEFLKCLKHSEYYIVDQLKKTLAMISFMSLILSSKPRKNALQKMLNEA